jgi:hypothetical protein
LAPRSNSRRRGRGLRGAAPSSSPGGRSPAHCSALRGGFTWKRKLFVVISYLPKATVRPP